MMEARCACTEARRGQSTAVCVRCMDGGAGRNDSLSISGGTGKAVRVSTVRSINARMENGLSSMAIEKDEE